MWMTVSVCGITIRGLDSVLGSEQDVVCLFRLWSTSLSMGWGGVTIDNIVVWTHDLGDGIRRDDFEDSGFIAVDMYTLVLTRRKGISIYLLRTQTISSLSPHGVFSILSPSNMKGSFISLDEVWIKARDNLNAVRLKVNQSYGGDYFILILCSFFKKEFVFIN